MNKAKILFISLLTLLHMQSYANVQQDSTKMDNQVELYHGVKISDDQAVTKVEYIDVNNRSGVYYNVNDLIRGQFAGVFADGKIRGKRSLESEDIYTIVDGFERDLKSLIIEEIESIQVLKSSVATALYGQRAANGAIIVKTKTGKAGKLSVNVKYEHHLKTAFAYPEKLDAADYARAFNEARILDGQLPMYAAGQIAAYENGNRPYVLPNVDWASEVFKNTANSRRLSTEFSGGNDKIKYYSLLTYNSESSFKKKLSGNHYDYKTADKNRKFTFMSNLDINMSKSTNIKLRFGGAFNNNYVVGKMSHDLWKEVGALPANAFPVKQRNRMWGSSIYNQSNPVANVVDAGFNYHHQKTLRLSMEFNQNLNVIAKGLSATMMGSYYANVLGYDNNTRTYESMYAFGSYDEVNDKVWYPGQLIIGKNTPVSFSAGDGGQDKVSNMKFILKYNRQFGAHSLNAFAIAHAEDKMFKGYQKTYYNQTFAGYVHYAYKNKYIADFSLTQTGYSTYRKENRWNMAGPSAAVAWIVSEESFMENINIIDDLKLRASMGTALQETFNGGNPRVQHGWFGEYYFGIADNKLSGVGETSLPNFNILPEKATTQEFGVDMAFAKNFNLSFTYWKEQRTQIKVKADDITSVILGQKNFEESAGQVDSWGYEASLGFNKQIDDFGIHALANYSFIDTEIVENGEANKQFAYQAEKGKDIDVNWAFVDNGFWKDQAEIDANKVQYSFVDQLKPGDVKYIDQNGDKIIDENDKIAYGKGWMPNIHYSLNLGLTYKNAGLDMYFDGIADIEGFDREKGLDVPFAGRKGVTAVTNNRWTPKTHETAEYPRYTILNNNNNNQPSTIYLKDKSYFKFRKLDVYYDFNNVKFKGKKICDARLYFSCNNIFSVSNYEKRDPEARKFAPAIRTFSLGCNLKF